MSIKMNQKSSLEESRSQRYNSLNRSQIGVGPKGIKAKGLEPIAEEEPGQFADTAVIDVVISSPITLRLCSILPAVKPLQEFV